MLFNLASAVRSAQTLLGVMSEELLDEVLARLRHWGAASMIRKLQLANENVPERIILRFTSKWCSSILY